MFQPILKEAHRAVKEAKVEATGSDVTLTGHYKADFDLAKIVPEMAKQIHEAALRITTLNNFKQCMLALHNIHSAIEKFPSMQSVRWCARE